MPSQRNYISDVQNRLLHPIPTYSTIYRRDVQPAHKLHDTRKFARVPRERGNNNRDGLWPGGGGGVGGPGIVFFLGQYGDAPFSSGF